MSGKQQPSDDSDASLALRLPGEVEAVFRAFRTCEFTTLAATERQSRGPRCHSGSPSNAAS